VREMDLDVPVILCTGHPSLDTAMKALDFGALRYLTKPVGDETLREAVEYGVNVHRLARLKREALKLLQGSEGIAADRAGLQARFSAALADLWMAFQPIVSWSGRRIVAFEALVRTGEPTLANPAELLATAERLGMLPVLGQRIRQKVSEAIPGLPTQSDVYVNLHPLDLEDPELLSGGSPLAAFSKRVVLEITERASLDSIPNSRQKIAGLRAMGYRIAVDDLGAGYAGLSTFAALEPDVVKLDMSLTRDVDREPVRLHLVRTMVDLCRNLKMQVITEGVETQGERDAIAGTGCDLMQGYLFARPSRTTFTAAFG
jgi:EAL domain-containing protein (putative c-di-GMP-specific phosphodiesterase class I)